MGMQYIDNIYLEINNETRINECGIIRDDPYGIDETLVNLSHAIWVSGIDAGFSWLVIDYKIRLLSLYLFTIC